LIWNPPFFNFHCDTITHGEPNTTLVIADLLQSSGSEAPSLVDPSSANVA
jgi:hypothetical protein